MNRRRESSDVILTPNCLAVFLDETGHEELADECYAFGGVAALGQDLERLIYGPWRELRRRVTGSPDTQLHANKFPRIAKSNDDFEAVATFFRGHNFFRFGASFSPETDLLPELNRVQAMKGALQERLNEIIDRTLCEDVKLIFEASDRTNDLIEDTFQNFDFYKGEKRLTSECGFMPKRVGNPALEAADFVAHAIGRQARNDRTRRGNFLQDFRAVFHAVDPNFISYMAVDGVARQSP